MKAIPCTCPVCSHATINDIYSQTNPAAHLLIGLHNLYQFVETNRLIGIMGDDDEVLADYAKSKKERELIRNVASMLDEYEHSGYRSTYGKFKDLIEGFSIEKSLKGGVRTTRRNIQRTRLEAAKTLANRSVLSAPSLS